MFNVLEDFDREFIDLKVKLWEVSYLEPGADACLAVACHPNCSGLKLKIEPLFIIFVFGLKSCLVTKFKFSVSCHFFI